MSVEGSQCSERHRNDGAYLFVRSSICSVFLRADWILSDRMSGEDVIGTGLVIVWFALTWLGEKGDSGEWF